MSPGPDVATRLAFDRTRLAYDRTLMAWVRTSTSMITFGFSVYKFFQIEGDVEHARVIGPREFALLMVGLGLFALLLATFEYRRSMGSLKAEYPGIAMSRATVLVATLMSILGVLALTAVLLRK